MKKKIINCVATGIVGALLFSCSAESVNEEMSTLNSSATAVEVQDIAIVDLVGTWKVQSMISDVPVNLDLNETSSTNILEETNCFEPVYFTFEESGSIQTGQANLYFETDSGAMECKFKEYEASYTVDGDQLEVSFPFNGSTMTEHKTINLYSTAEGEFLAVSLEYFEAQTYLPENPETPTGAADIRNIQMVYKKVE